MPEIGVGFAHIARWRDGFAAIFEHRVVGAVALATGHIDDVRRGNGDIGWQNVVVA